MAEIKWTYDSIEKLKEFASVLADKAVTLIVLNSSTIAYVGQSINDLQTRAENHLRHQGSKLNLNFSFHELATVDRAEAANVLERLLIHVLQNHPKVPGYVNVQNYGVKRTGSGSFTIYIALSKLQSELCQQK